MSSSGGFKPATCCSTCGRAPSATHRWRSSRAGRVWRWVSCCDPHMLPSSFASPLLPPPSLRMFQAYDSAQVSAGKDAIDLRAELEHRPHPSLVSVITRGTRTHMLATHRGQLVLYRQECLRPLHTKHEPQPTKSRAKSPDIMGDPGPATGLRPAQATLPGAKLPTEKSLGPSDIFSCRRHGVSSLTEPLTDPTPH